MVVDREKTGQTVNALSIRVGSREREGRAGSSRTIDIPVPVAFSIDADR